MSKFYKHLKTICRHKYYVGKYCFKFGLYKQGILHDLSKFSFTEFFSSAKYFQGDRSPIAAEKEAKGYSAAWLHHKSRNKHHSWYWVDWDDDQAPYAYRIPRKYVYEMIADWIGAGMVYNRNSKKGWSWSEPYEFYKEHNRDSKSGFPIWEFATKAMIDYILVDLKEYGIEYVANRIKRDYYGYKFYNNANLDGKENFEWLFEYNDLVTKYYSEEEENEA